MDRSESGYLKENQIQTPGRRLGLPLPPETGVFSAERLVVVITVLQKGLIFPNSRSVAGVMLKSADWQAQHHTHPLLIVPCLSFSLPNLLGAIKIGNLGRECRGGAMYPWQGA